MSGSICSAVDFNALKNPTTALMEIALHLATRRDVDQAMTMALAAWCYASSLANRVRVVDSVLFVDYPIPRGPQ